MPAQRPIIVQAAAILQAAIITFTLASCSAPSDSFEYRKKELLVAGDEASPLGVQPPFYNDFGGGSGSDFPSLLDGAGNPTGFSMFLPRADGGGYLPENLAVGSGELTITTSAGIPQGAANTQDNALGVAIPLPNGIFRVETSLLAPPVGSGAYEQAGVWFGISQRDYVKLVLMSAPNAIVLQALIEENDIARSIDRLIDLPVQHVTLSLEINPALREVRAYATGSSGAEQLVAVFSDVAENWFGIDAEGNPGAKTFAGIFATHRNRARELDPLVYRFGDFGVQRGVGLPSEPDITAARWTVVPAFPEVTFVNPTGWEEAPGTGHAFVSEREGRLFAIPLVAETREKKLVLDLSRVTQGHQDLGLLGLAFHPEFGQRQSTNGRYMYLHYAYTDQPVLSPVPFVPTESRLSRFTVDLDTLVADPASELVLIAQQDEHLWHQGGAMFFHPKDGFLYLTVGDEGDSLCRFDNCQRIDRDLFSGVLRIDVDMRGGAISHPIVRQPESGSTAHYFIPSDNPFVGEEGVLEEFYAIGLRSPHRMTHDALDDITWIGDVGQSRSEELDVLQPAANYQWQFLEGTSSRLEMSEQPIGVWTDPVLELGRDEANAIIGGVVYRGSAFPELWGKYIFGDYFYGTIWALDYEYDGVTTRIRERQQLLTGMLGRSATITSFGLDLSGELYILAMGQQSQVMRLQRGSTADVVPERLSRVGVFDDLSGLAPVPEMISYAVQSPLWSDGASKRRWMLPPPGQEAIQFSEQGPWQFPEGTVFVKHFDLALDERRPDERRRLETRFLVAAKGGRYYGLTYKWNAEGTDAEPLFASQVEEIDVVEENGNVRRQSYFYPGPSDCLVCHNADAGYVLGVRTAQLNGTFVDEATGVEAEQLLAWTKRGLLDTELDEAAIATLPSLAHLGDADRSVEDRVRSYWDSNCSMCHGVVDGLRATWDARYQTPLANQGVIYGSLSGEAEPEEGSFVVVPGSPSLSAMWRRDRSDDIATRMPPLGRHRPDNEYLKLLEEWISSLTP
jgi:uncharacterized repeat protein (TIGR03806 family)